MHFIKTKIIEIDKKKILHIMLHILAKDLQQGY
jgi:hypothetical protein